MRISDKFDDEEKGVSERYHSIEVNKAQNEGIFIGCFGVVIVLSLVFLGYLIGIGAFHWF